MLSGVSKGSRAANVSGKSGPSVKSGKSAKSGQQYCNTITEERGHLYQNSSAHAGGKKDSVNSNLSNLNAQHAMNSQSQMSQQQSQQVLSNHHQGGALQTSQRIDSTILIGAQRIAAQGFGDHEI